MPGTMKVLVYEGVGKPVLQERPIPELQKPTDAIVKMLHASILDLWNRAPYHQRPFQSVGTSVKSIKPNDKVLIANIVTSCRTCDNCKKNMPSHCLDGGWVLGHKIDETQAEYVRIPHADGSVHLCGDKCGRVTPGCTIAIVGAGPVGLSALIIAQLYSPSTVIVIDLDQNRLKNAKRYGATNTVVSGKFSFLSSPWTLCLMFMSIIAFRTQRRRRSNRSNRQQRRRYRTVIETAGTPNSFDLCQDIVTTGGIIANLGVHGHKVDLHMDRLWGNNITVSAKMVDATSAATLIRLLNSGKLNVKGIATHQFKFDEMVKAYETFGKAAEFNALKMMISF
ncbi:hypothetical protein D9758_001122 [Tetrapyrgos nigripes]|uniref:Uncharacterized protein n=1 Tax=Tetrapyrgos nigripes TaxID=182062 RepID=A0A8H5GRV7_9AGAR|nr:hypothetical protein D9758_001122 [Tetrapyrgos nigripes]